MLMAHLLSHITSQGGLTHCHDMSLLASMLTSILTSIQARDKAGSSSMHSSHATGATYITAFIMSCLQLLPIPVASGIAQQVLISPLIEVLGSPQEVYQQLLCAAEHQARDLQQNAGNSTRPVRAVARSYVPPSAVPSAVQRLHALGFMLGVSEWKDHCQKQQLQYQQNARINAPPAAGHQLDESKDPMTAGFVKQFENLVGVAPVYDKQEHSNVETLHMSETSMLNDVKTRTSKTTSEVALHTKCETQLAQDHTAMSDTDKSNADSTHAAPDASALHSSDGEAPIRAVHANQAVQADQGAASHVAADTSTAAVVNEISGTMNTSAAPATTGSAAVSSTDAGGNVDAHVVDEQAEAVPFTDPCHQLIEHIRLEEYGVGQDGQVRMIHPRTHAFVICVQLYYKCVGCVRACCFLAHFSYHHHQCCDIQGMWHSTEH